MKRIAITAVLALAACGIQAKREASLRTRASFDLKCPEGSLALTQLGDSATYGVVGCDKRATYVQNEHGSWIMNSPTDQPASTANPTPSPSPEAKAGATL